MINVNFACLTTRQSAPNGFKRLKSPSTPLIFMLVALALIVLGSRKSSAQGLENQAPRAETFEARFERLWTQAKWENLEVCGILKVDLQQKIAKHFKKNEFSNEILNFHVNKKYDQSTECRIAQKGFIEINIKEICEYNLYSNRFLMLDTDKPVALMQLNCIGDDSRVRTTEITINLK